MAAQAEAGWGRWTAACVLAAVILAGAAVGNAGDDREAVLPDDECGTDGADCALNHLQLRARMEAVPEEETTTAPVTTATTESATTTNTTTTTKPLRMSCLCAFDVDRTLTGKQYQHAQCPRAKPYKGVSDTAYGGGELLLSELGEIGVEKTFCSQCMMGIISTGDGGGANSKERRTLTDKFLSSSKAFNEFLKGSALSTRTMDWNVHNKSDKNYAQDIRSPIVIKQQDKTKHLAIESIIRWYNERGIGFLPKDVFFFDDRADNVEAFKGTGFNALQISCLTRDGALNGLVGFCGATVAEVNSKMVGVKTCASMGINPQKHLLFGLCNLTDGTKVNCSNSTEKAVHDIETSLSGWMKGGSKKERR